MKVQKKVSCVIVLLVLGLYGMLGAVTPIIHWTFDGVATNSGSGGAAYDAVLVNGPVYTNGTVGSASLALDGVDDYVSVAYTMPDQGSIALWYYAAPWYNYQSVFDNSVNGNDWEMWIDANGGLNARLNSDSQGMAGYLLNGLNESNHWYHIVYTWDGAAGQSQLFVNGALRKAGSITNNWVNNAGTTFYLGGGNAGNTACNGRYDDVRIYTEALDKSGVQELFGAVIAVHLPFNGNPNDIAPGLDNHAELFGNFAYVDGVDGQALELKNTTTQDYARVDYKLPEEQGSISLWYYPVTQVAQYNSVFDNSVNANAWEMWTDKNNVVEVRVRDFSGRVKFDLDELSGFNQWYHIVYTWERAAAMAKLFVNGVERSSDPIDDWVAPGRYFYLGGGNSGGNTNRSGRWDDVRIYNRAVSPNEVKSLYREYKYEVVYLPFDGDAIDGAGATNTVTVSGNPQYVKGSYSLALDWAGVGANVAIEHTLTEEGSIAMWYYAQGPWYNYQSIFDNSVNQDDWEMWIYNDGRLRFRLENGFGDITYDLDNLDGPNHWYHVAVTWERNGSAKLYVNGVKRGQNAIGAGWVDPGSTIYLGGHTGNSLGNGAWDEVHIYNYALDLSEIEALAFRPPPSGTVILIM